jgi:hypothetical protein
MRRTAAVCTALAALVLAACSSAASPPVSLPGSSGVSLPSSSAPAHHHHRHHHRLTSSQAAARNPGVCDPSLWRAIYHPYRLHVVAACKTVNGRVDDVQYEPDGDVHLLLRLPSSQSGLLNSGNIANTHGDLVVEIICVGTVTQADAEATCAGHVNQVAVPSAGERVRVSGTYVLDADHGWMEIHPVSRLTVLPAPAPPPVPPPPAASRSSASPTASSPAAPAAWCTASASYNSRYHDYDVYVHSNQPDRTATATASNGKSWSYRTNGSGYADIFLYADPGNSISVMVGPASCSTTAG